MRKHVFNSVFNLFMLHSSIQRLKWSPGTRVVGMYDFEAQDIEVIVLMILQKIDLCLREW